MAEFRALFAAYTVSMLGDIVAAVALTVLVYQRTASPFLAGVTFTLAFVPYLFSRRPALGARRSRAAAPPDGRLRPALGGVVALMALSAVPVPVLLALLFVLGLISPVSAGMRTALARIVLPDGVFIAGRSLFRIVAQSAQVVGNGAGGLLIALDVAARGAPGGLRELRGLRRRRALRDAGARAARRRGGRRARAATCCATRSAA